MYGNRISSRLSTSASPLSSELSDHHARSRTIFLFTNTASLPDYGHGEHDVDDTEDDVDDGVGRKMEHFRKKRNEESLVRRKGDSSSYKLNQRVLRCSEQEEGGTLASPFMSYRMQSPSAKVPEVQ